VPLNQTIKHLALLDAVLAVPGGHVHPRQGAASTAPRAVERSPLSRGFPTIAGASQRRARQTRAVLTEVFVKQREVLSGCAALKAN